MIDSCTMREVDGLDDGYICHYYLIKNSDEAKVNMAQTWTYNSTSRRNSDSIIQWLVNEPTA